MSNSVLAWTLGVQLGAVTLIALFFLVFSRSARRSEVRDWSLAWAWHAVALAAAFAIADNETVLAPGGRWDLVLPFLLATYCGGKTLFGVFQVRAIREHVLTAATHRWPLWRIGLFTAAWGLSLGFLAPEPRWVIPLQWLVTGLLLLFAGGWTLLHGVEGRTRWLAFMLLAEGLLFAGYVPLAAPVLWGGRPLANFFEYSSLFDAGVDLLLALATLAALESSRSVYLERLNRQLEASHEQLRRLVDNDPLTGLNNRRGLRQLFDELDGEDSTLVYLDIDDFKIINDRYGHAVGDACLIRVASVLNDSFRPGDGLFRWGGDEFLVVAPGLGQESAQERVEQLRAALAATDGLPPVTLSAGVAHLEPGGDLKATLAEADRRMYSEKRGHSRPARRLSSWH